MSQSQGFGNYQKRKYISSPKKRYFSPKRKISNAISPDTITKSPTILHYFSPTSESKSTKLASDLKTHNPVKADSFKSPNKESARRVLFDSKDEPNKNEVIIIPDDDDADIKNFDLHIESKKNSEKSKHILDHVNSKNFVLQEKTCINNYSLKLLRRNNNQNNTKIKAIQEEKTLDHSPKGKEILPINSPTKAFVKIREEIQILEKNGEDVSPTKSVLSVEEATSFVGDIDWWDENDFGEQIDESNLSVFCNVTKKQIFDSSPKIITASSESGNKDVCSSSFVNVEGLSTKESINERSESTNYNSDLNKNEHLKTDETNSGHHSYKLLPDSMSYDPLYYILTTPPASLAWKTIFNHSQFQNVYKNYISLATEEKQLYSRLFPRKYDWIRLNNIKYDFVSDVNISLNNLAASGFVKFLNPLDEELSVVLNLMQVDEVKKACEIVKANKKGKKSDMIENILVRLRSQRTLQFGSIPPINRLRQQVLQILPQFVKLEDGPRSLFMSFLLISTYPQVKGRDDNRMEVVIDLLFKLKKGEKRELGLPLSTTQIFKSLAKFREYEESVNTVDEILQAKKEKKWEDAKTLLLRAKTELIVYLGNEGNITELDNMPVHMRKYTPGSNYVYVINEGMDVLKKDKTDVGSGEAVECLVLLLSQKYFQSGRRASWYCELALIMERWKKFDKVFETLKQGLEEESLTSLGKLTLAQRCEMLIKRKHGLSVPQKDDLAILSEMNPYRFSTNTIPAKAMPNVTSNKKQMWTTLSENSRQYMGVEEVVRQHYLSCDGGSYSEGYHDEGRIIINLAVCVFWDVIYTSLDGMFQVRLQDRPLDWGSSAFYKNRSELIEKRIDFFKNTGIEGIMNVISEICTRNYGTLSMVSWELIKLEQLPEIKKFLECVGVEQFLKFCDYLLQSYKERSSGLPDLTLWNVNKNKCLFVEVKGPSDKLSVKQVLWLQKLNEFGIEAEVCHVHTLHTGKKPISSN